MDAQNLFYAAKEAFGYSYPNYDPKALAERIVSMRQRRRLVRVHFYTGMPDPISDTRRCSFWSAKLTVLGRRGVVIFAPRLHYRSKTIPLPNGTAMTIQVGQEKGIDIRIALDIVRLARENTYGVVLILSQDQDLSEAVEEIKAISRAQSRWIKVVCPFPVSPSYHNRRGVNGTDWIKIDRAMYDACLDPRDYR